MLSWKSSASGPEHDALWTATAYSVFHVLFWFSYGLTLLTVNGTEYGHGTANSKGAARNEAARQALDALMDPA